MSAATSEIIAVNTMKLAHSFLAVFTLQPISAVRGLRMTLGYMKEHEFRQWIDYMGDLLVDEEVSAELLHAILLALESLNEVPLGTSKLRLNEAA